MNANIHEFIVAEGAVRSAGEVSDAIAARQREADHRIANSFQIAAAILSRKGRGIMDVDHAKDALREAAARLLATARVHRTPCLTGKRGPVVMSDFLGALVVDLSESTGIALDVQAEGITLPVEAAIDLGVIVSEMVINTAKHGVRAGRTPALIVDADSNKRGDIRLRVCDDGPGLPDGFDPYLSRGLGMSIIVSTVERLGGSLCVMPATNGMPGAGFEIVLPPVVSSAVA